MEEVTNINYLKKKNMNLQFKTNINCDGCIAKVTPFLNEIDEITKWEVDTTNKDKILSVQTESTKERIIQKVQEAGFKIELL